jgi:hypothetical protein
LPEDILLLRKIYFPEGEIDRSRARVDAAPQASQLQPENAGVGRLMRWIADG